MSEHLVTVVIPIYKTNLTEGELKSLTQCVKLLSEFPIVFIQPESLNASPINHNGLIKSETFEDHYFESVFGYNSLMLSPKLYERFTNSKYILIYQLDAYVFKNELKQWCLKDYDYIGAPWIPSPRTWFKKVERLFHSKRKREREVIFYKVGNGGFSLRKVASSLKATQELKPQIEANLNRDKDDFWIMEDVFWSLKVPEYFPDFKIPYYKEALGFAMDRKPELAFKMNNNHLPFGCHGFEKSKVKTFLEDKIK